ncbi:hypothetical protein LZ554_007573 [Drepanopeziza brunnea f. sp. 'monogermtubi']|nr:hypothetical protein LZ554_007573 [Drepanopeziza brunnea f. sp. 'monogermtubi']
MFMLRPSSCEALTFHTKAIAAVTATATAPVWPPFDPRLVLRGQQQSQAQSGDRSASSGNAVKSRGQRLGHLRRPSSLPFPLPLPHSPHHRTSQHRLFSSTRLAMTATKIDGTAIAKSIRERIHAEIEATQKVNPQYKPSLKIIQVGDRSDSSTYVRAKLKAAEQASIDCELLQYPETISEVELLKEITRLNHDTTVHGILVQLPVPAHISEYTVTSAVADEKDVDGFGARNIGELAKRGGRPLFIPCTARGVMSLLDAADIDLTGKNAVVLGRSNIVGSPVSYLLKNADATVTVCHSRTVGLEEHVKNADILVAAIGKANFVKGEWLKQGVVVIDVGINFIPDETKKSGQRLVGDVDFASASEVASYISPVPGGVGPMTVAMLLQNVVDSAARSLES